MDEEFTSAPAPACRATVITSQPRVLAPKAQPIGTQASIGFFSLKHPYYSGYA